MDKEIEKGTSKHYWRNPITFIAVFILVTVILLIAANVLGIDKGQTLQKLANIEFARGLITYLFAVGTIGVIIIVILAILLSSEAMAQKIKRAKDVMTILIGIFGTIIGFYFGSQNSLEDLSEPQGIEFAPVHMPDTINLGEPFSLSTMPTTGESPYEYWIIIDSTYYEGETVKFINQKVSVNNKENPNIVIYVKDKSGNWGFIEKEIDSFIHD